MIRFTCGDMKILSNIKMSENIMTRIVAELNILNSDFFLIRISTL